MFLSVMREFEMYKAGNIPLQDISSHDIKPKLHSPVQLEIPNLIHEFHGD